MDLEQSFQLRVDDWMQECFGPEISADGIERNHRFLEEALELVQSLGCTDSEAHQLVGYVYGRPVGEPEQEVGGVRVTLAALCNAHDISEEQCGEVELERIWGKVEKIRAKQAAKPKHSPLPEAAPTLLAHAKALEAKVHEAKEIYTGMDGFKPENAAEAYLLHVLDQMWQALTQSTEPAGEGNE